MPLAKQFVTEEEATLMLQRFPNYGAKNCTVRLEKPLCLNYSISTFREKGKRKREQATGIQVAERTSYSLGRGSILWHILIPVILRKGFAFTIMNTLKEI